jgi:ribosomal protein S18 acetylase RimI-like enzyme
MDRRFRYCPVMPDAFVLRSASPDEAAVLLLLMRQAFAEYRGVLQPESSVWRETEDVIAGKLSGGGGILAVAGERPVGCVIAEPREGRGYLGRLAVDPGWRRRGVARALMPAGEGFLRGRGLPIAEVNVRIALAGNIALFEALGYRETARAAHPGYPAPTYLVMEKSLV